MCVNCVLYHCIIEINKINMSRKKEAIDNLQIKES